MVAATSPVISGLAFRRQFVLGPDCPSPLAGWHLNRVADGLMLSSHPDLAYSRVDAEGRSLVLLGYVLDPAHPERSDEEILSAVLRATTNSAEILTSFADLGGRWAVIYLGEGESILFHDAAAVRQVYHTRDDEGALWCGSRPELLSRVMGAPEDTAARQDLVDADVIRPGVPHYWPGTSSGFVGIDRLLPNHLLDLQTGEVNRYWPTTAIPRVAQDEAVARCAAILTGTLDAAARRFRLALSITAGRDSRLLLAASLAAGVEVTGWTFLKTGKTSRDADVRIPQKMLRELGIPHKVITVRSMSDHPVADVIRATFSPVHSQTADQAAALALDPPTDDPWVTVNGNVSEVARCVYSISGRLDPTPENFAARANMGRSSFAAEQFAAWWEAAQPACRASSVDPWDLYYWEGRLSAWFPTVRTEFDVVEEVVSPYNCRALIECMLGVDAELRSSPDFAFFRNVTQHLDPRVLEHPINPPEIRAVLKYRYRRARTLLKALRSAVGRAVAPRRD